MTHSTAGDSSTGEPHHMSSTLSDQELVDAFENDTLSSADFRHETHIRLAWLYLRDHSTAQALTAITEGLERLTARLGVPERYHATITYGYTLLINQRLEQCGRDRPWHEFAAANPDLFEPDKGALLRFYRPEELDSSLARKVFVLPTTQSPG